MKSIVTNHKTVKYCKNCQALLGDKNTSGFCLACYGKDYRQNHREFMRKQDRERYHKDIDISRKKGRGKAKKHRLKCPELVRKVLQKCYYKNINASRESHREYAKKYRQEHLETSRAYKRKWYYENTKKFRVAKRCKKCRVSVGQNSHLLLCKRCYQKQYNHKYYYKDLLAARARDSKYHQKRRDEHPEAVRESARKCYYKDVDASRLKNRVRAHNNVLKFNERRRNRYHKDEDKSREKVRAENLKRSLLTPVLIKQVYARNIVQYGSLTCYLCNLPIAYKGNNLEYKSLGGHNLEHLVPICRGGTHTLENMNIAHALCNKSKYRKTYQECLDQHIVFPPETISELKEVA